MVEDARLAAGGYRMKDTDTKSVPVKRAMGIIHSLLQAETAPFCFCLK